MDASPRTARRVKTWKRWAVTIACRSNDARRQRGSGKGLGNPDLSRKSLDVRKAPRISGIAINLLFNVVLPLIAVNALEAHGVGVVRALAISAVFPLIETGASFARTRRVDAIGAISLTFIALGVAASLISGDVHFALAKESFFTAIFGLLCLGSLLAPRPLLFYTGRSFVGAGDPAREAEFDSRWIYPTFRHVLRVMTVVWGCAFLCEAAARVALAFVLPVNAALVASPVLAMAVFGGLMLWTIRFGKAAEQRAAERRAREAGVTP
jgi:hypothetical protein